MSMPVRRVPMNPVVPKTLVIIPSPTVKPARTTLRALRRPTMKRTTRHLSNPTASSKLNKSKSKTIVVCLHLLTFACVEAKVKQTKVIMRSANIHRPLHQRRLPPLRNVRNTREMTTRPDNHNHRNVVTARTTLRRYSRSFPMLCVGHLGHAKNLSAFKRPRQLTLMKKIIEKPRREGARSKFFLLLFNVCLHFCFVVLIGLRIGMATWAMLMTTPKTMTMMMMKRKTHLRSMMMSTMRRIEANEGNKSCKKPSERIGRRQHHQVGKSIDNNNHHLVIDRGEICPILNRPMVAEVVMRKTTMMTRIVANIRAAVGQMQKR